MKREFKYTIINTFIGLFLFWLVVKYGTTIFANNLNTNSIKEGLTLGTFGPIGPLSVPQKPSPSHSEGLTDFEQYSQKVVPYPKNAVINYNDINSPLYSHTVNLPINDPVSCKNFCGPNAKCLLTGEQCTSDINCYGCKPVQKPQSQQQQNAIEEIKPYDDAGKLGQNQGLQYSPLTTGFNGKNADFSQIYPGSKDAQLKVPYQGVDLWMDSFNKGLQLYNKKRESADKYNVASLGFDFESKKQYYEPKYPMTLSATGQFYETTPPASNSAIQ
jgi:hypothetical protein